MIKMLTISILMLTVVALSNASAHPATERYIPIGKSPGISGVKSYVGKIRSVHDTESGFAMTVENATTEVRIDETTMIYVDTGSRSSNRIGTEEDCEVGRTVEVYLHDSGVAYWVKIQASR